MPNSNKVAKKLLELKYGKRCMLTGLYTSKLSYHHTAQKKEDGGRATEENGTNLLPLIHQWLHNDIEHNDIEKYWLINECLILYKMSLDLQNRELIDEYEQDLMPRFNEVYLKLRKGN
jgi:hypothetical protein